MHSNNDSDRITEFSETDHGYASDSALVEQLAKLSLYVEERLADVNQHIDHIVSHDRINPTPGCSYCEVRRAS